MKKIINCSDFICFDLETTGLSVHTAEIIEIGAVKVKDWEILEGFHTFVKPSSPISCNITELTGISDEDVKDAPSISEVLPAFLEFIKNDTLLGHNIEHYDLPILKRIAAEYNLDVTNDYTDTLSVSRAFLPELPSHSLEALCDYYEVENAEAHRAISDSLSTAEVYRCIMCNVTGNTGKVKKKKKERPYRKAFSDQTQALVALKGIITGIACDNVLSEDEVFYLKGWLDKNTDLSGNYPFDIAFREVSAALADGVLEQSELDHMLDIFKEFLNPVETKSEHAEAVDFSGKTICLSGDFETGSKDEVGERLTNLGAVISKNVTKAVDYLIVGEKGSAAWSCGNYGTKVKKALEMQGKGHTIKILRECEIFNTFVEV